MPEPCLELLGSRVRGEPPEVLTPAILWAGL